MRTLKLQKKFHKEIDIVLCYLFLVWLIVDMMNGLLLNSGFNMPISQVFKLIIFAILFLRLLQLGYLRSLILGLLYISVYVLHIILINESIGASLLLASKLILTVLIYLYFRKLVEINDKKFVNYSYHLLLLSYWIVAINILIGLIGIGYYTYPDEKIGYKGFFFAGNEMGGLLVVLIPFYLYISFFSCKNTIYFAACIFSIIISFLLGTKSVILIGILSVGVISWMYGSKKAKVIILFTACIIVAIGIMILSSILDSGALELLNRMEYSYNEGGITSMVFSGRDVFWKNESQEFYQSDFVSQLFGLGGNRTVEQDHRDSLLNFGYIGFFFVYSFYMYLFVRSIKNRRNNTYGKIVVLTNVMLLGMSFIAGHIIYSSMAGLYISLQNSLCEIHSKKNVPLFPAASYSAI